MEGHMWYFQAFFFICNYVVVDQSSLLMFVVSPVPLIKNWRAELSGQLDLLITFIVEENVRSWFPHRPYMCKKFGGFHQSLKKFCLQDLFRCLEPTDFY